MTKAMDVSLILYAEHEYNASTFAARVVSSTLSDMHSAITAAIGALKGPLHGGANEAVMEVLEEVGTADKAEAWIRKALANKRRIMGFGHRVYKTGDPARPICARCAANWPKRRATRTWKRWPTRSRRSSATRRGCRRISIGPAPGSITTWVWTSICTRRCSSSAAWLAGARTSIEQLDNNRLIRPRANYTGPAPRKYVPVGQR